MGFQPFHDLTHELDLLFFDDLFFRVKGVGRDVGGIILTSAFCVHDNIRELDPPVLAEKIDAVVGRDVEQPGAEGIIGGILVQGS